MIMVSVNEHGSPTIPTAETAPTLPLMHAAFVLAGLGTMLLGPILPLLATRWHLLDSQLGVLILSQFIGATIGGATTTSRLQRDLLIGLVAAAAGFSAFALSPVLIGACAGLFVGGFGVGRTIATVNILAGQRYTLHRASALSWLNFSWSFGALLSPLSAAQLASRYALTPLLLLFAAMFAILAILIFLQVRLSDRAQAIATPQPTAHGLHPSLFLYFAALLLIYGGLETCISAWLTTYAFRYGKSSLVLSEYTMVLFLVGLTTGRALAAAILKRMRDTTLLRASLLLAAMLAGALALAHTAGLIATAAVLLGICLAPIFPATFAITLAEKPTASQAGMILAASGLGAASLPWLMGIVSTYSGSLQLALILPVAAALILLGPHLHPAGDLHPAAIVILSEAACASCKPRSRTTCMSPRHNNPASGIK